MEVPLGHQEMLGKTRSHRVPHTPDIGIHFEVQYSINRGVKLDFYVPGANQNMRWAAHSVRF